MLLPSLISLLLLVLLVQPCLCAPPPSSSQSLSSTGGLLVYVSDYGAYPDDGLDDTDGIQEAINVAILAPNSAVILNKGVFDINDTVYIRQAVNLLVTGITPLTTIIVQHGFAGIFSYYNCSGLVISLLAIDLDPLPFTGGMVVAVSNQGPYTIDVKVVPPHIAEAGRVVTAVLVYDPVAQRPAFGPSTYEIFQSGGEASQLLDNSTVRFFLTSPSRFAVGNAVVVRFVGGPHAISGSDSNGVSMQHMIVYSSWDMSHVGQRVHGLEIVDYHVKKRDGRWMSTWADCMHFGDCRQSISIVDSSCEGMGDDGLNVHNYYFNVTAVIDSQTVQLSLRQRAPLWDDILNVGIGTALSFAHPDAPLAPFANYTIAALVSQKPDAWVYSFTQPVVGVLPSDVVNVAVTPSLYIRNFTVAYNRARGALLETHNIVIEQSFFNHTSGPCLLMQPSFYWGEAPPGRNVTIRDNVFLGCNQGIAQQEGVITLLPDPVQLQPVLDGVYLYNNSFFQEQYSQQLIMDYNGINLNVADNYIQYNYTTQPPFAICNSKQVTVTHNCLVGATISGNYNLDKQSVCDPNLSSGLMFSADAFTAQFGPPVLPAPDGYGVIIQKRATGKEAKTVIKTAND